MKTTIDTSTIIARLEQHICDGCNPIDQNARYEEMLRSCYPETIDVCGMEMDAVRVLREMDETAYDCGCNDYMDSLIRDNDITDEIQGDYYDIKEAESAKEDFVGELRESLDASNEELSELEGGIEEDGCLSLGQIQDSDDLKAKIAQLEAEIDACESHSF